MESGIANSHDPPGALGFYSVTELDSIGYCGGLLVLNEIGRPLEFHCTLPVLPERAQEILYGNSLKPYLLGEHIGPPLIARAKSRLASVFVNSRLSMGLDSFIKTPVVFLWKSDDGELCHQPASAGHRDEIERLVSQTNSIDLIEPFERIQMAIEEAHAVAR